MKKFLLWIWQLPQNLIGAIVSIGGEKKRWFEVNYYVKPLFKSGVSLGNYIIIDPIHFEYRGSFFDNTIKHEHGHQLQSLYLGPLYLIVIGLPSLIGNIISRIFHKDAKWYYNQPWEKWADKLGKVER